MTITAERSAATAAWEPDEPLSIVDPYDPRANAETFDYQRWLAQFDWDVLRIPDGRRALTRLDPLLFHVVYLRHHLTAPETDNQITFADCHLEWARLAREWVNKDPGPRGWRHQFASPRNSGKSTWWYTLNPIWAAAHGHARFVAAFADSGTQAEMHLQTFRTEAQHNELLRRDYLNMCLPQRKPTGKTVSDNEGMFHSRSGFVFAARGADTAALGMKVGDQRPDVIILDDFEKDESNYSPMMVQKRKVTLIDAIFPLNERARVVMVGTTTRPGSINHQCVQVAIGEASEASEDHKWIKDERIIPHWYDPTPTRPDGTRRSIWPAKWSLQYLESIEHTRNYEKNFKNNPRAAGGAYWKAADIKIGIPVNITRKYLFVDPPTTTKKSSDPCGIALLGWAPGTGQVVSEAIRRGLGYGVPSEWLAQNLLEHELASATPSRLSRVAVLDAWEVRLTGTPLKRRLLEILGEHPDITEVVLENNQGGDLWTEIMAGLPVKFRAFSSTLPKDTRFTWALNFYQRKRVTHAKHLSKAVDQMTGLPKVEHDDVADVIATGICRLLIPPRKGRKPRTEVPR